MRYVFPAIVFAVTSFFFSFSIALAAEHTVRITAKSASEMQFEPEQISVAAGDTITWFNETDMFHNVKSDKIPAGVKSFVGKGMYKKGDKWSYVFETEGSYGYFCVPHKARGMVGTVMVQAKK